MPFPKWGGLFHAWWEMYIYYFVTKDWFMCGIFGMIGERAVGNTLKALKLLEYRGYDSAGVATRQSDGLHI